MIRYIISLLLSLWKGGEYLGYTVFLTQRALRYLRESKSQWTSQIKRRHTYTNIHICVYIYTHTSMGSYRPIICCCSVAQLCLTLCDSMDCSLPGSSVRRIFQARILEWVVISFSRGLPNPGIEPESPALPGGFFTTEPPGQLIQLYIYFYSYIIKI